jgi:putative endonuclease
MFKRSTREIGASAEKMAEDYLRERDYEIILRNFRSRTGEIDLVAKKRDVLVFVEVKSESVNKGYFPEEKVDPRKQEKIFRTAQIFLLKNFQKLSKIKNIRFDVVVVNLEEGKIRHYESAFYAEGNLFKDRP